MAFTELKQAVYETTMTLYHAGLIRMSAGNVSARDREGHVAITPGGVLYDRMNVDDIVIVDLDGHVIEGRHRPSSETPMHTALLKGLPECRAVVHTHSIYAMTFAVVGEALPPLCTEGLAARGTVPVARYAPPGTQQAGEVALEALQTTPGLRAVLLRNHGLVVVAPDLETAWQTAYKVEIHAQITYQARQLGTPTPLSDAQIAELFRVYRNVREAR